MILTFVSGLLIMYGWQYSYLIYLMGVPIAILFYLFVPSIKQEKNNREEKKVKITWLPILSVLFASIMVMNSIAITVRFPGLAVALKGISFNTSNYLAVMPVLGIVAGFLFQKLTSILQHKILYLSVIVALISNLLIAISNDSFFLLVCGLMISSIPVAWVLPYLFNHIEVLANGMDTRVVTSFIFLGCNFGVLVAPILMKLIELIGGTTNLYFPFFVFIGLFILVLIILHKVHIKIKNK